MIRTLAAIALAAVAGAAASAETLTIDVGPFTAIDAANGVTVAVAFGPESSVVVDGPANQIDNVQVSVAGGVLRVRPERAGWFRRVRVDRTTVLVTAERLSDVEVANGARIAITGMTGDGGLSLSAVNGGMLEIDGACGTAEVRAGRGGMVDAGDLACRSVIAAASMGGLVEVNASQSIEASASMGGQVSYVGEAELRRSTASMGGFVSRKDD
jgi:hypothetical protein